MTEIKVEFAFTLNHPIEFSYGGEVQEGNSLTIKCPSNAVLNQLTFIEQQFLKAQIQAQKLTPQEEVKPSDTSLDDLQNGGNAMIAILMMGGADVSGCYSSLRQILTSPKMCYVNGHTELTDALWKRISPYDIRKLLGEYIINFIMPSLLG